MHGSVDRFCIGAVHGDEATDKAGLGVIRFDVFAEFRDTFLQIIDTVFLFQDHTVDSDDTVVGEIGNQTSHFDLQY